MLLTLPVITSAPADNIVYGHANNVVEYSFYDTVVDEHLILCCVLDIEKSPTIRLVVETRHLYFAPITSLGTTSATQDHFVYVERGAAKRRPCYQRCARLSNGFLVEAD